ncbi:MAG: carbon starvation protein A, partial [Rikenellaceae bacterium]|nr:carbon starvation protein A [Rikenellaceae bacterium]
MITFLVCFVVLIASYFVYGGYLQRVYGVDKSRQVPSDTMYDGVDYVPMPLWKTLLIQLLNIAGLGPIFGAVLGAVYGPVAFIW